MSRNFLSMCVIGAALCAPVPATAQLSAGSSELISKHLIDIGGGRRLNMVCIGHGSPTVVFEYGLGSNILHWQKVQEPVSAITRACFYDRAGYGFSDPSREPMTADNVTNDLHALLHKAGISLPVVLVGHSIGGFYATLYSDRFGSDVAGFVLIDPGFADRDKNESANEKRRDYVAFKKGQTDIRTCANLARAGKLTLADPHDCFQVAADRTSAEITYLMYQFLRPFRYESVYSEAESFDSFGDLESIDGEQEERAAKSFDNKLVIVLTAGTPPVDPIETVAERKSDADHWKLGHDKLAARSTRGASVVVPQSGHFIQLDQPQAVVDAIRKVVLDVRGVNSEAP